MRKLAGPWMGAILALGAVGAGVTAIKQILAGDAPKPAVVHHTSCPAKGFTEKDAARLGGYVERSLPALAQCFQQALPRVRLKTRATSRTATIEIASEPGEKGPQVRFVVDGAGAAAASASAELVHDERFRACAAQQLTGTFPEKYAKIPVTVRADLSFDFANRRAVTAELVGAPEVEAEARGALMEPALAVIREKFALFAEDEGAHGLTGLNVTVGADGRLAAVDAVTAGGQIGPAVAKLAEHLTGLCLPRLGRPYEYSLPVARDDDEH